MELCKHEKISTGYSTICVCCGLEVSYLPLDTYSRWSAPLSKGYCRAARWKNKILRLVGLHSGPSGNDPVWPYLHTRKDFLKCPDDIRLILHNSKLKFKHYDCIRIFSDTMTQFRIKPQFKQHNLLKILENRFAEIYAAWNLHSNKGSNFFSYTWLLRMMLNELESPLVVYLKPKTSRRRNQKYIDQLTRVRQNGGILNHKNVKTHLQNEISPIKIHHDPLRQL